MKRGKKYIEAEKKLDRTKVYSLQEGIELVKDISFTKFPATVEVSVSLSIRDKNYSVRDTFVLPHQFTAEKRILVFAKGEKADEARAAGATYVGDDDLIQKIRGGWMDFDVCIATLDMMKDVGKLGPALGRRGLMPNPRTKTATNDLISAIAELKRGRVEFRADKTNVVHLAIGKLNMDVSAIKDNLELFLGELMSKCPPSTRKGDFIRSVYISSTMGPGVKLDISAFKA